VAPFHQVKIDFSIKVPTCLQIGGISDR